MDEKHCTDCGSSIPVLSTEYNLETTHHSTGNTHFVPSKFIIPVTLKLVAASGCIRGRDSLVKAAHQHSTTK